MSTTIQLTSDLHLDRKIEKCDYKNRTITDSIFSRYIIPSAQVLILSGDICDTTRGCDELYELFIDWCCARFEHVVLVAGNHEFFHTSIDAGLKYLKSLEETRNNFRFLEKDHVEFHDVVILGTTMWSYVPEDCEKLVRNYMNDFNCIEDMTTEKWKRMHMEAREWLSENIKRFNKKRIVVATHHTPEMDKSMPPKYRGSPLNCAFGTDMSEFFDKVDVWVSGHTHWSDMIQLNTCKLYLNCGSDRIDRYKSDLVVFK